MVGRTERATGDQRPLSFQETHDAINLGGFDCLVVDMGGRIDGMRRASIVLPDPGGPIISTL